MLVRIWRKGFGTFFTLSHMCLKFPDPILKRLGSQIKDAESKDGKTWVLEDFKILT